MGDDALDFNFWPSFADSMLAVVFVLIVVLVFVSQQGLAGISSIRESQSSVVRDIADAYDGSLDTLRNGVLDSRFVIRRDGRAEIEIQQKVQLQRITFRGNVLFSVNDYRLTAQGEKALEIVGKAIVPALDRISQLQIEGHTDLLPTNQYAGGNLELGARRARMVFRFLVERAGIDPATHLMSATSYGPYRPVGREPAMTYTEEQLWQANNTETERRRNRRIELLLFFDADREYKPAVGGESAVGESAG